MTCRTDSVHLAASPLPTQEEAKLDELVAACSDQVYDSLATAANIDKDTRALREQELPGRSWDGIRRRLTDSGRLGLERRRYSDEVSKFMLSSRVCVFGPLVLASRTGAEQQA